MRRSPILGRAGIGLALALSLSPLASHGLARLAAARHEQARLQALVAHPPAPTPLLAREAGLPAQGTTTARQALTARVRSMAKAGGLLVEDIKPAPAPRPLAAIALRLSGPEKALIAFADTLERDPPLVRLERWRLTPLPGGNLRLDAVATGVAS